MTTPFRSAAALMLAALATTASATMSDLTQWTEVEDPPHPNMSSAVVPNAATLVATGSVPTGTDIGYQSVDGNEVFDSTSGYYFSPSSDFRIAIDFDVTAVASTGGAGIGFGIGEDGAGTDSAGVGLALVNGLPTLVATAARDGDADLPIQSFGTPMNTGRFFVEYESLTGDVIAGLSATPGAATPDSTSTIAGVQSLWEDDPLLVSFFLRSQAVSIIPALDGTSLTAVFSNFEVLEGTPIAVIPEPASLLMLAIGAAALAPIGRRQ